MLLMILLTGHMIADFALQPSAMAENKRGNIKSLLVHSGIYLLVFAFISFMFVQARYAVWITLIIAGVHFIVDFARTKIDNKFKYPKILFSTFLIDQIMHLTTIIITYYSFDLAIKTNSVYSNCEGHPYFKRFISYCLLFVVLIDPAAVFIKKTFAFLFGEETKNSSGNSAGSVIGKLERVITAILLLCNQYGVIGLVLTAKSIARFKQLEDQDFAEKYLIGTLLSILISLIMTLSIKYLMSL